MPNRVFTPERRGLTRMLDAAGEGTPSDDSAGEHRQPLLLGRGPVDVVLLPDGIDAGARRAASSGARGRRSCHPAAWRGAAGCRTSARRRCPADRCVHSRRGTACRRTRAGPRRGSTGCRACGPACARARSRRPRPRTRSPGSWTASSLSAMPVVRLTHGASARCTWIGHSTRSSKPRHALDRVAGHRATDVVRVVMGGQDAADGHAVGLDRVNQFVDAVRRVDEQALARRPVPDGVHEVDHLRTPAGHRRRNPGPTAAGGSTDGRPATCGHGTDGDPYAAHVGARLEQLTVGQPIVFGGDRVTSVPEALAAAFVPGDRLLVVQETGDLLHVPATAQAAAADAVTTAASAFGALSRCTDDADHRVLRALRRPPGRRHDCRSDPRGQSP